MDSHQAFLASPGIQDAVGSGNYGAVLRLVRQARGLTQAQAGHLAGYSAATISRFETGTRRLADIGTLRRIAAALGTTPEIFGLTPGAGEFPGRIRAASPPGRATLATVVTEPPQDGDDVRRRELLTGLAGVSAAAFLAAPRAAAGAAGPDPVTAALEDILTGDPGPGSPVPASVLRARLAAAWRAFDSCRYQQLAGQLPALVAAASATRAQAVGSASTAASAALADGYVLVSELAEKAGEDGMAWVAADRALAAARDSGDATTIAAASRAVAIAMRRLRHYDAATTLLTSTALSLGAGHGTPPAPVLAAYGSLLCTAAYASAQNGRRHQALDLITEASAAATRMPATAAGKTAFSAAGVQVYQIGIHTALGDSAAALAHARSVIPAQLPTPERRARYCIDTARAWQQHNRPDRAYQALLAAERQAPEEICRSSVRALITTMTQGSQPRPQGLGQLSERARTRP